MMGANSNFVLTVSFALLVGAASAVKQINDIQKYPACLVDNDCTEMHKLRDHACFQYFCYPWKSEPDVASAPPRPLQECRRASDCPSVTHPSGNKKQPFVRQTFCHGFPSFSQQYSTLHFFYLVSERERIFQYTPPSDNTPLQAKKARKA